MVFRVEISPKAVEDLDAIAGYIRDNGSLASAEEWFNRILAAIRTLREMPARCPVSAESRDIGREVRVLLHGGTGRAFKVYYAVEDRTQTVQILHVRHWAKSPVSLTDIERFLADTASEKN